MFKLKTTSIIEPEPYKCFATASYTSHGGVKRDLFFSCVIDKKKIKDLSVGFCIGGSDALSMLPTKPLYDFLNNVLYPEFIELIANDKEARALGE